MHIPVLPTCDSHAVIVSAPATGNCGGFLFGLQLRVAKKTSKPKSLKRKTPSKAAPRKKASAKRAAPKRGTAAKAKPAKPANARKATKPSVAEFDATAIAEAVAVSAQLETFSAAYEQTQQTVEALEYCSCRYITDDLSDNSDVQLRVTLAEFNLLIKNQAEGYTYPTLGMVLLSEYRDGDGDNAEYKVLSIADLVVPVDDAHDLMEFAE